MSDALTPEHLLYLHSPLLINKEITQGLLWSSFSYTSASPIMYKTGIITIHYIFYDGLIFLQWRHFWCLFNDYWLLHLNTGCHSHRMSCREFLIYGRENNWLAMHYIGYRFLIIFIWGIQYNFCDGGKQIASILGNSEFRPSIAHFWLM